MEHNSRRRLHRPVPFEAAFADDGGAMGAPELESQASPWPEAGFAEPTTPGKTAGQASFIGIHGPEASV